MSVPSRSGNRNTIGGTSPEARNLISGNDRAGVFLSGTEDNRVEGNLIGTSKDGTSPLGNGAGVATISSSGNTVGGSPAAVGAANTIAFNRGDGVVVIGDGDVNNRILGNSIFSNGDLGIDLGEDEGKTFLGETNVSTGGSGNASFTFKTKKKAGKGQNITATATDPNGNTSEFSGSKAT